MPFTDVKFSNLSLRTVTLQSMTFLCEIEPVDSTYLDDMPQKTQQTLLELFEIDTSRLITEQKEQGITLMKSFKDAFESN